MVPRPRTEAGLRAGGMAVRCNADQLPEQETRSMWFPSLLLSLVLSLKPRAGRRPQRGQRPPARRCSFRPTLEALEDRALPSSYTAGTVADLIADINAANAAGGANTITLNPGTT